MILATLGCPDNALKLLVELVERGIDGQHLFMVLPGRNGERWVMINGTALVDKQGLERVRDLLTSPRVRPQVSVGLAGYLHDRAVPYALAVEAEVAANRGDIVFALHSPALHFDLLRKHQASICGEIESPALRAARNSSR